MKETCKLLIKHQINLKTNLKLLKRRLAQLVMGKASVPKERVFAPAMPVTMVRIAVSTSKMKKVPSIPNSL